LIIFNKPAEFNKMKDILTKLLESQRLTRSEAMKLMHGIASGEVNESQSAAVLTAYIMRNISIEELLGFRDALMELARQVDTGSREVIDVCGTGGDGKNTFNISTLTAFVVAGAGVPVAKHGNYGVSSASGSSNVMEYLGYRFTGEKEKLQKELEEAGICFMHAPLFHPALKAVGKIRKQIGVKTFFNILGPLVNPANPSCQVSGVFNMEAGRIYSYLLQRENKKFVVIHSLDGYDEVSLTSDVSLFTEKGESLLPVESFGLPPIMAEEIAGGESVKSAGKIFMDVLNNRSTVPQKNTVIANSALALQCYRGCSLETAVADARDSIESHRALGVFKKLTAIQ